MTKSVFKLFKVPHWVVCVDSKRREDLWMSKATSLCVPGSDPSRIRKPRGHVCHTFGDGAKHKHNRSVSVKATGVLCERLFFSRFHTRFPLSLQLC